MKLKLTPILLCLPVIAGATFPVHAEHILRQPVGYVANPILGNFSIPAMVPGDTVSLAPPRASNFGPWRYTSSNPAVAAVTGTTLTAVGVGAATITATLSAGGGHAAAVFTADVSVASACTPGQQAYATPGDFTFTFPAGCTTLTAKVWGAGGAGGYVVGAGGAGGFAAATVSATGGSQVSISVGGSSAVSGDSNGGGASAVLLNGTELAVGGGGGGGGGSDDSYNYHYRRPGQAGGSAGNTVAGHAGADAFRSTYSAYGSYANPRGVNGASGYGTGGRGADGHYGSSGYSKYYYNGGGGGGYLGGANSGSCCSLGYAGYGGTSYSVSGTLVAGDGTTPGNTADVDYAAGAATPGQPGRVVLIWQ